MSFARQTLNPDSTRLSEDARRDIVAELKAARAARLSLSGAEPMDRSQATQTLRMKAV